MKIDLIAFASGLAILAIVFGSALALDRAADTPPLNPLSVFKAADLTAFSKRPLFTPSRRPVEAEALATQTAPDVIAEPTLEFRLLGITSGPDRSIARIAIGDAGRSVRKDETIEGWHVVSIEPSSVALSRDGQTKVLTIFDIDSAEDGEAVEDNATKAAPRIVFEYDKPVDTSTQTPKVRLVGPNP